MHPGTTIAHCKILQHLALPFDELIGNISHMMARDTETALDTRPLVFLLREGMPEG